MNMKLYIQRWFAACLVMFALGCTVQSHAQPKPTYTIADRKAIKKYEEATDAYRARDDQSAMQILSELVAKYPDFAEAQFLLAQVYLDKGQMAQAMPLLEK
ncbi:MAG: tetratricopeptide repeat protein, partial [Bacteroidetes bacterium]|nr:tetratricopeptide repeat protein [Bacteroidota bacterium]